MYFLPYAPLLTANPFTGLVLDFEDADSSLTTPNIAELIRLDKAIYDGEIQKEAQAMFYGGRIGKINKVGVILFAKSLAPN